MTPRFEPRRLGEAKAWEYAVRFLFGGVVTVGAGLAAKAWGPVVGGLFLAFPAILPASLTLVKQHEGRPKAIDDARGGTLGSIGLAAFGLVVWGAARDWPIARVLAVALIAWLVTDVALWWSRYGSRHSPSKD